MEAKARRIDVNIKYDDKDISKDLKPYFLSLSYNDVLSGQADDIQITLREKDGIWKSDWMPEKGATLIVSLFSTAWKVLNEEQKEFKLGIFEIDEIEYNGYPETINIKAVSVPDNNTLRGVERTKSWEKTELKVIAQEKADNAGMTLYYDTEVNPVLDRAEQTQQSDLSFLLQLCNDQGLALKICNNQIIIFDEEKYEAVEPQITIVKPYTVYEADEKMTYINSCLNYRFTSKVRDIYAACHVKYQQSKTKETIEATFTAPNKQGKVLEVKEQVESVAEAQRLAKKRLREKNRDEITGSILLVGNFDLVASTVVNILGYGNFDGKYIITNAKHDIQNGYTTSVDIRRCLDGY